MAQPPYNARGYYYTLVPNMGLLQRLSLSQKQIDSCERLKQSDNYPKPNPRASKSVYHPAIELTHSASMGW